MDRLGEGRIQKLLLRMAKAKLEANNQAHFPDAQTPIAAKLNFPGDGAGEACGDTRESIHRPESDELAKWLQDLRRVYS